MAGALTLVIETSNPSRERPGEVGIARGDELVATRALAPSGRHDDALMPAVAGVCEGAGVAARELERIRAAAELADAAGLEVHAGHGLAYDTVKPVAALPQVVELNIGHFLIGEAIFCGLEESIRRMRALMDEARADLTEHAAG